MENMRTQSLKYDIFSLKSEEMKFNAFFSYLRSFAETSLDTIHKLQNDFQREMKKHNSEKTTLATMKNILSAYEVFVLELKDSCDFVELPQFGFCIGKTYSQMLKIIKWFLSAWLRNSKKCQQIKHKLEVQQNKNSVQNQQTHICAFCEQLIRPNQNSKEGRNKRKGVAVNQLDSDLRYAKKHHKEEMNHMISLQQQVLEKYTMKEINSKRYISDSGEVDILTRKHAALKLEFSNNGNVLQQVLNEFNLKTEAIARFVMNSQAVGLQQYKMTNNIDYQHFQQEMKARIAERYIEAKQKLKKLVAIKLQVYEKVKLSKMSNRQTQTDFSQNPDKQRYQQKLKVLMLSNRKLKNQLQSEKMLNQSLKKLMQTKSIQFQQEFLNYRKEVIMNRDQPKSKEILPSLKTLKEILEDQYDPKKENNKPDTPKKQKMTSSLRLGALLKDKDKFKKKKKNSIRFTLENQSIDSEENKCYTVPSNFDNEDSIDSESQVIYNTVATQTEPQRKDDLSLSATFSRSEPKFFLINRNEFTRSASRELALEQSQVQAKRQKFSTQQTLRKQANLYSHVKSRVYDKVTVSTSLPKKQSRPNTHTEINHLVKKLAPKIFPIQCPSQESQIINCHQLTSQPIFSSVSYLSFTSQDVYNLFLSPKNAQNYQCLLYRNSIFNNSYLNPKRAVNYKASILPDDLDWSFKKQFDPNGSVQHKLTNSIFNQFNNIKRKQRAIYDQLKLFLRSPAQIGNKMEIISLQTNKNCQSNDIELAELRKMVNIILRLHIRCLGSQKEVVCGHLVQFCSKIGIKFI